MIININGNLESDKTGLSIHNRAFKYGDGVFETLKVIDNKPMFWESHYLRLMASIRILRIRIPIHFTPYFLSQQIKATIEANGLQPYCVRIRITVYRNEGGFYLPNNDDASFLIEANKLEISSYIQNHDSYKIDVFKEFKVNTGLLSNLKTTNKLINVLTAIHAKENLLDNCLYMNHEKHLVEASNANLFVKTESGIKTPPLADGCINGILRKQIIEILKKEDSYMLEEVSISVFDLLKAESVFLTNSIQGIIVVKSFKKTSYNSDFPNDIHRLLINEAVNSV